LASKRWVNYESSKPGTLKVTLVERFDFAVAHEHRNAKRFSLFAAGEPREPKCCEVRFVISVVQEIKSRTFD
jgi:hypothetical protein